ncbi:MAG: hypothetical protein ACOYZ8_13730 [Chloroflexota bacterium]
MNACNSWSFCGESIMDLALPPDFKEFLRLLKDHNVRYLLIGGYAVGYHGYARATEDMDIWVVIHPDNAERLVSVLKSFGFDLPELKPELFLQEKQIVRMGVPPLKIEICTFISGVDFEECYQARVVDELDGVEVSLIDLEHLKKNKKASGRARDLADFERLP